MLNRKYIVMIGGEEYGPYVADREIDALNQLAVEETGHRNWGDMLASVPKPPSVNDVRIKEID